MENKPTAEELKDDVSKALETLENNPDMPDFEESELQKEATPSAETPVTPEPEQKEVVEVKPQEEEGEPEKEVKPQEETVDYKKKFTESQREAIVQTAQRNELEKVIDQSAEVQEPTEEELLKEYPEWDDMTAIEQKFARKTLWNDKRFSLIEQAREERKNIQVWNTKVDDFVADPANLTTYPELEGKTEEFKQFASKPTRRGLNFDDLVLAFNGELVKSRVKHTGKMFETGANAAREKMQPKNDKISIEESIKLRDSNYDEWKRLLKAGKIASS